MAVAVDVTVEAAVEPGDLVAVEEAVAVPLTVMADDAVGLVEAACPPAGEAVPVPVGVAEEVGAL